MANHCKMLQLHLLQRGKDYLQSTPALLMRSEVHWFVLLWHPLNDLGCFSFSKGFVRWALCLTSKFGWQFTDKIHNLQVALIFWHICWVLGHILESHHNFWILHGCKNLWITKNFIEPRHPCHSRHAPSHSRHSSRKITRHSPRKATWKRTKLRSCLSSGFLPLGSLMLFSSLLNPFNSFFDLSLFTFLLIFSLMFSNFLGPWLNFFQHCTSIIIIIQFTGKG